MFKTVPLALGANVFGWTADLNDSFAVLDKFLESEATLIDSADGYSHWKPGNSGGESETIIGEWLTTRNARKRVQIATKVSTHPDFKGLSPLNVRRAAEASLKRLNTDSIDLYYAHYDDPEVPIVETAAAFSGLVDAGKVRAIGLSNYSPDRINEWFKVARAENLTLPVALQPHYNLVERDFESNGLRDVALTEKLSVFPYYSLAKGFLTGKYRSVNDVDAQHASPRAESATGYLDDRGRKVLTALDEIAAAKNVSVTAVALSWLKHQPTVMAPIASARNTSQLAGLLESLRVSLTADEQKLLNTASQ
ncbi:MAG TPA: aldo/keto reductase [Microbacteriaceae bacterium]|nr:aldo/keto reductase [Microbacteriaceae bacterium]